MIFKIKKKNILFISDISSKNCDVLVNKQYRKKNIKKRKEKNKFALHFLVLKFSYIQV